MDRLSFYNFSFNYRMGGYGYLTSKWRDYNVLIDESKLFYITKGELVIRINGVETLCKKGDIVLVPAGVKHDYYLPENGYCEKYWFMFKLSSPEDSLFDEYDLPLRFFSGDKSVESLFATAISPVNNKINALDQANAVFSIVSYYFKKSKPTEKTLSTSDITEVIHYIYNNLSYPITLALLANKAHLSPNYFVRAFKQRTGISPMKMLSVARLEKAKQLLSTTNKSISAVMEAIGHTDSAYFSKSFKAYTGYSPRAYRNSIVKKD